MKIRLENNDIEHSITENDFLGNLHVTMNDTQTPNGTQTMANRQPIEGNDWEGIDKTVSDPEEARVIFSALDSFS